MTDTFELEKRIRLAGFSKSSVAHTLGITPYGFSLKCKNKNEFKASEIAKLQELLGLNQTDIQRIFFAK